MKPVSDTVKEASAFFPLVPGVHSAAKLCDFGPFVAVVDDAHSGTPCGDDDGGGSGGGGGEGRGGGGDGGGEGRGGGGGQRYK